MMVPTVHLNGTSGIALLSEVREAKHALFQAQEFLCSMTVHGRDYYVQDKEGDKTASYTKAVKEHEARISVVQKLIEELDQYEAGIMEQRERNAGW